MVEWVPILLQIGTILAYVLIGLLIVGGILLAFYFKKKQDVYKEYRVIIYKRFKNKNGEEFVVIDNADESGGIIKDKKLDKWVFHLKKTNLDMGEEECKNFDEDRELDIPSLPGPKGNKVVFIEKIGTRKYCFAKPWNVDGKVELIVSEADLAEAKRSYHLFVKSFSKKTNPVWVMAFYFGIAALTLVLILVVLNKFDLIVTASENFKQGAVAVASKGAAVPTATPG